MRGRNITTNSYIETLDTIIVITAAVMNSIQNRKEAGAVLILVDQQHSEEFIAGNEVGCL